MTEFGRSYIALALQTMACELSDVAADPNRRENTFWRAKRSTEKATSIISLNPIKTENNSMRKMKDFLQEFPWVDEGKPCDYCFTLMD